MAKTIDGIIEAVRYKNEQIVCVRAYERRGAAFSDRVLLDRKTLAERIKNRKQFVTGSRRELMAGTFEIGAPIRLIERNGRDMLTTKDDATRDELEGVPVF